MILCLHRKIWSRNRHDLCCRMRCYGRQHAHRARHIDVASASGRKDELAAPPEFYEIPGHEFESRGDGLQLRCKPEWWCLDVWTDYVFQWHVLPCVVVANGSQSYLHLWPVVPENSWDFSASTHSPTLPAALSSLVWQSQPDNLTYGVSFVSCAMVSRHGLRRRIAMHSTSKCGIPWVASHVECCDIWRLQLSSWYPIAPTEKLWVTSEVVAPMNLYIVAICNSYLVLSFHSAYTILRGLLGNSISQTIDEHERKHCITGIGSAVLSQGGDGGVTAAFSLPSFARCVRHGSAVPAA